jgi:hypothetical protein
MFRPMRLRKATIGALAATAAAVALALIFGGTGGSTKAEAKVEAIPGEPTVAIVSPRNGAVQSSRAVVVTVDVQNFELAPEHFDQEPELDEGMIRFSLNRVPDCVDPKKLERAIKSPLGNERLKGRSFDYPQYSGANGVLAERIDSAGSYSPATRPVIYYHELPPGFYRMIVALAQNNGAPLTGAHAVTNFQILPNPKAEKKPEPCPPGKVPSAKAAARLGG